MSATSDREDIALAETRAWLERAVIGLNLCPFAKAPHAKGQIRFVLSRAADDEGLLADLQSELETLIEADPARIETTLLVHPLLLADFDAFNDFLDPAEALLEAMELVGVVQLASFHPRFRFEGTEADDLSNATNRSPYPTLHLLREASVERAVEAFPDPAAIFEANLATLDALGVPGWDALRAACRDDAVAGVPNR
ncbi:MAG: DUF1415 domain-containing protein [Burkholderiaceae bacterium]